MHTTLYVEINVFAIIISSLIYLNIYNKTDKYMTEQKLFIIILLTNISILISDALMFALNGRNTTFFRIALLLSTLCYFLLQPVICMFWSIYVDFQINRKSNRLKKLIIPMLLPVFAYTFLSIVSLFNNYFIDFSQNNKYHQGKYFMLLPIISFLYIFHSLFYLINNRQRVPKSYYKTFISFAIPPIIGALIQSTNHSGSLIWVGMTISIFIVFINIQNQQMYNDYLTGLYNRRQLDFYLQDVIAKNKIKIAGILLDINSFKRINDQFGHSVGDEALKHTAYILKKSFRHNSFISRLGGDEFVIILEVNNLSELERSLLRLHKNVLQFNQVKTLPYTIDYSIGSSLYPSNSKMTGQEFLNHIDALMYLEKQAGLHCHENAPSVPMTYE